MPFDLDAYLSRIDYDGPRDASFDSLAAVHRAHALAVPFENLDVQMGLPIRLDLPSLVDKIVTRRRGGYCFEQNTLFLEALRSLGFATIPCEARVVSPDHPGSIRPRTHMVLVTSLGGRDLLCDVGFGGDGPVEPVPMDGTEVGQLGDRLRVARHEALHVLQLHRDGAWRDEYRFEAQERHPIDFEVANWYTSTFPESSFVRTLTAQRVRTDGRHVLRNLDYSVRLGDEVATRSIVRGEVLPLLSEVFGIDLPADARLRALDG